MITGVMEPEIETKIHTVEHRLLKKSNVKKI